MQDQGAVEQTKDDSVRARKLKLINNFHLITKALNESIVDRNDYITVLEYILKNQQLPPDVQNRLKLTGETSLKAYGALKVVAHRAYNKDDPHTVILNEADVICFQNMIKESIQETIDKMIYQNIILSELPVGHSF